MRLRTLGIVIPIIIIAFSYGVAVGVYEYFPYEILDSSKDVLVEEKTIQNNQFVNQDDVGSLIKINNKSDIDQKRSLLTEFFWNVGSFHRVTYDAQLPEVEYDISDSNYSDFQNLKQIDRLTVEMEYGINSISYLFIPKQSNEKLILYHQGHGGDFILGKEFTAADVSLGYSLMGARNKLDNDFPKRVSEYWESISSRGAFLEAQKRNE